MNKESATCHLLTGGPTPAQDKCDSCPTVLPVPAFLLPHLSSSSSENTTLDPVSALLWNRRCSCCRLGEVRAPWLS